MNFCWVTIEVSNLEESLKFYHELLGLKISSRFGSGSEVEIAMLGEADQPKVELLCNKNVKPVNNGHGVSLGFGVDSLDKSITYMNDNAIPIRGPISPAPNVRFFFIKDPDGYEVQIVESNH